MSSSNPMPKILALLLLIGAIAVAVVLFQPSEIGPGPAVTDPPPAVAEDPAQQRPDVTPDPRPSDQGQRTAVTAAPEVDTDPVPATYRAALSGLTGRVVERDGTPVADLKLDLIGGGFDDLFVGTGSWFDGTGHDLAPLKGSTRTGDEGRFTFTGVDPTGMYGLSVDPAGARGTLRFIDSTPNSGETRDIGDVVLEPFVTFIGRVEDDNGSPVEGARVRATDLPAIALQFGVGDLRGDTAFVVPDLRSASGARALGLFRFPAGLADLIERLPIPTTTTLADGSFRLPGIPAGLISVVVDHPTFVTHVHPPTPSGATGGERSVGTIRIDHGEELIGHVVDGHGTPVVDAEVMAGPLLKVDDDSAMVRPIGRTDDRGRFSAPGFTDDEHMVAVRPAGLVDWTIIADVFPGMADAEIRVPAELTLAITARRADGGSIPRPTILVRPLSDGPGEMPTLNPPRPLPANTSYTEDGVAIVSGLTERAYSFLVQADGYANASFEVEVSDANRSANVELKPAHELAVTTLIKGGGEPIHFALIQAFSRENAAIRQMPLDAVRTSAAGQATLRGLADGTYQLRVQHPGFAATTTEVTVPCDPLTLEIGRGGVVVGRVHERGQPPGELRFVGIGHDHDMVVPKVSLTDADGAFRFEGITPGTNQVVVLKRFANRDLFGLTTDLFSMGEPEREVEVQIVEGEEARVDIDLSDKADEGPTANVRGRVLLNGRPAAQCQVNGVAIGEWRGRRSARTDENGQFDLGRVQIGEHGQYQITVNPAEASGGGNWDSGFYIERLQLAPDEYRELAIQIRSGSLRGVVYDATGQPVAGAQVLARTENYSGNLRYIADEDGNSRPADQPEPVSSQLTLTDRDGTFSFATLMAGTYVAGVEAKGFVDVLTPPVVVPFGGEPPALIIRLTPAIRVKGLVVFEPAVKPSHVWLQFQRQQTGTENAEWQGVNADSGSQRFETDDLVPGDYNVTVMTWDDGGNWKQYTSTTTIPEGGTNELRILAKPEDAGG